jgi:hypothetical protein
MSHLVLRGAVAVAASLLAAMSLVSPTWATGDANTGSCPNEASVGFMHSLPDCRAYEMVSPPFKDGWSVASPVATSTDGSGVMARSFSAFAGAENSSQTGPVYAFSRTSGGWTVSAISPPASEFPVALFRASDQALGRTLWMVRTPSEPIEAGDLYRRESDGSLVSIGPMAPPSRTAGPPGEAYGLFGRLFIYAGASRDLSRVLFALTPSEEPPWPGDTTAESADKSLYEYVGSGNKQPALVGVNAEGHLIGDCETRLGGNSPSSEHDVYNAVSASGETVFLSVLGHNASTPNAFFNCGEAVRAPEVTEVYARLNQLETVAISEPIPSDCQQCNTATREPAVFQGASQDGSKVFFLTEQELLPGATTQNLYEYDFDNPKREKIVRVASGSPTPEVLGVARVSQDGSHVFFVARGALTGPDREGRAPVAGQDNLYVFERDATSPAGRLTFIATLSEQDSRDWQTKDERPVQATPNGRYLVFLSAADLTTGDLSTEPQVFEYDALSEELVRVSRGQAGYAAGEENATAHSSTITAQLYSEEFSPATANLGLAVSADGSRVVFESAAALAPGAETAAEAGKGSVYEYRSAGPIANGNAYLISDGKDTTAEGGPLIGMDPSGENIYFITADPLLPQDVDTQFDIYDARENGGFPTPATATACTGEACHGTPSTAPSLSLPQSIAQQGGDNLAAPLANPTPKRKALTRAQKLARALKACRRKPRKRQAACVKRANRLYGGKAKSRKRAGR